ncbi:alpha/beta fold hydrolase [Muricoccus radiodurans]|uniref:alpha/beta fold hydrolase n=1 Tax=Muricoccus radiodurans TaxID=2231721 RepID=UPI003CF8A0A6
MTHLTRRSALLAAGLLPLACFAANAAEDRFFDSAGVRIRYIEEGQGEPVILIHGYTNSADDGFVRPGIFPALARRYRAIALDARGHGQSGKPHDRAAYGPEMGLDIIRLMDHLNIRRAHIVGYSMGAHIVAQLVTTHENRFLTMTLGGASGRRNWTAEDQRRVDIESAEMDEGMLRSQIMRLRPRDQPAPSDEEIRRLSAQRMEGKDPRALAAVRRSNPDQVVTEAQMRAVTVPSLGIVGTADPYLAEFQQLKAAMPQLQLVTIEGASHGSAPGRPEFIAALMAFLAAHPATT